ncbi:ATP/GTP-binding protein [Neptuniibacter sp. 1_MG-2023]|uniref:GTP-binding protein n=1 Tax=Neptuniibacter sp. 1_MG-2023 TaxID=3062662 RepID=UPI0026E174BE|nr:ATP/GTP-binding protein [Neptuniibacter sp. 1_MG-2023]MDO6593168.1 ATP/GTP-binding protein [Neptuniibacter sp. 1_MG-2023]
MKDYKILFTGSVCSGKTTAIRSVSDIETLDTDAQASDVTVRRKKNTTIVMDYGVLDLNAETRVHLYGTPGQERFRFMWDMLTSEFAHDAIGMVLLVDNTRKDPFRDIRFYAKAFGDYLRKRRLIIAVTHSDVESNPDYNRYLSELKDLGVMSTVMFVDARDPRAILGVIEELISAVERDIDWDQVRDRLLDTNGFSLDFYKPLYEETLLDAAMNKRGVLGAMHIGEGQDVLCSNIDDASIKSLLLNINRLTDAISEKASFLGAVNNVVIAGPKVDTLSVFNDQNQSLCLKSDKDISLPVLKQQAGDLLQWSIDNDYLA